MLDKFFCPSEIEAQKFADKFLESSKDKKEAQAMKVFSDHENAEFVEAKGFWGYVSYYYVYT